MTQKWYFGFGLVIVLLAALYCLAGSVGSVTPESDETRAPISLVRRGDSIPNDMELGLGATEKTVLIFLKRDCQLCVQSMPFYHRLVARATAVGRGRPIQIIVVTKDPESIARDFLSVQKLDVDRVVSVSPERMRDLKVLGVPAVVLVTSGGIVERVWFGTLTVQREKQVEQLIFGVPMS